MIPGYAPAPTPMGIPMTPMAPMGAPMTPMAPMGAQAPAPAAPATPAVNMGQNVNVEVNMGGKDGEYYPASCGAICCLFLFPPFGVCLYEGGNCCNGLVLATFCLTLLFYFPGLCFGLYVLFAYYDNKKTKK